MSELESFIWTEVYGVGEIIGPFINSFLEHHSQKIHIFGYETDLENLPLSEKIVKITLPRISDIDEDGRKFGVTESEISSAYKLGHDGTALLWSGIIHKFGLANLIHFDADTIFLADCVTIVEEKLREGYKLVGTRRPYRFRTKKEFTKRDLFYFFMRDTVNTKAFGFNPQEILEMELFSLKSIISSRGRGFPPVIDFFDRASRIIGRHNSTYFLDSPDIKKHGKHILSSDYERRMISFSAVGSGCKFHKDGYSSNITDYALEAIRNYAIFSTHLLDRKIEYKSDEFSNELVRVLSRLDRKTWKLT